MKTKILRFCCILCLLLCIFNVTAPTVYAVTTTNGDTVVYVTATGNKYHRGDCGHLRSKIRTTLLEAVIGGYAPCEHCDPPIYIGFIPTEATEIIEPTEKNATGNGSSGGSGGYGSSGRGNRTNTTKTNNSTKKTSSSTSDDSIADVIIPCIILGLPLILLILSLLWTLWEETPIHKRLLLRRKKKALQKQLVALSTKYESFVNMRMSRLNVLHSMQSEANRKLSDLESLYQCVASADGLPTNKNAPSYYGKYGKDFTVTIGRYCYHRPTCRHATLQEYHVLKIGHRMKPCKQCCPPHSEAWMHRYVELHKRQNEINNVLSFPLANDYKGIKTDYSILKLMHELDRRIKQLPKIKK